MMLHPRVRRTGGHGPHCSGNTRHTVHPNHDGNKSESSERYGAACFFLWSAISRASPETVASSLRCARCSGRSIGGFALPHTGASIRQVCCDGGLVCFCFLDQVEVEGNVSPIAGVWVTGEGAYGARIRIQAACFFSLASSRFVAADFFILCTINLYRSKSLVFALASRAASFCPHLVALNLFTTSVALRVEMHRFVLRVSTVLLRVSYVRSLSVSSACDRSSASYFDLPASSSALTSVVFLQARGTSTTKSVRANRLRE